MVLTPENRPIDDKERRYLKSQRAALVRTRAGLWRDCLLGFAFFGVFFGVLTGLIILAERKNPIFNLQTDAIIIVSVWVPIIIAVSLWSFVYRGRGLAMRIKQYDDALERGMCLALRIQAKRLWEFEELEDEGVCYAFELESGGVAFVVGQEFYPGSRFPNNDFSLVEFQTVDGQLLDMTIVKRGEKLVAERVISSKEKMGLEIPEHATFVEGTLENVFGKIKTA
jgi:hypothetical protein